MQSQGPADPSRVAQLQRLAREAAAPLERLPDFVQQSPRMMVWAKEITAMLSIEETVGVCFGPTGGTTNRDKKLKEQPEAKAVIDGWLKGRTVFDRQALVDSIRAPPHAAPEARSSIATVLLSDYCGLRKTFFLEQLLAGQHGRTSQRAASAIVKAVREEDTVLQAVLTSRRYHEYRLQFLSNAAKIERWYWKSQEQVPRLQLLSEAELRRRRAGPCSRLPGPG